MRGRNAALVPLSLAARLQDAVDPDVVRADLARVVSRALEPAHVTVWTAGTHARVRS